MGLGSMLLDKAKALRNALQLKVYSKNRKSVAFYTSKGFAVISESKDEGTGENELIMQWSRKK
jgi:putative acetyltransferase